MKRDWLIHNNIGSVKGGQYLVVLGQANLVMIGIKWKWSLHDNTGSVEGSTG